MGNDIGSGQAKSVGYVRQTDLDNNFTNKIFYWTSDQKAIKLNNVGHI